MCAKFEPGEAIAGLCAACYCAVIYFLVAEGVEGAGKGVGPGAGVALGVDELLGTEIPETSMNLPRQRTFMGIFRERTGSLRGYMRSSTVMEGDMIRLEKEF